ncbi:MAG: hypothetical protein KDC44_03935 [Phaeodactylibacter sp.]|nr:hypothetical protein [Phaeodactylibacter sp.]
MKCLFNLTLGVLIVLIGTPLQAQSLNWNDSTILHKHVVTAALALDYGTSYGLGYQYKIAQKLPTFLQFTYNQPFGSTAFDDFKVQFGAQVELVEWKDLHLVLGIAGIARRYKNSAVQLFNFGSETHAIFGYYRPHWHLAGAIGFDKAIATHFRHSDSYREHIYAGVPDGWYEPATGGNFYYGLQGGYSFQRSDLILKIGKVLAQDFQTTPLLPYYLQLGYQLRL